MPAHNYGQISPQQQLHFLCKLIKKIKDEHNFAANDKQAILELSQQLEHYKQERVSEEKLEQIIAEIKTHIEVMETSKMHPKLIQTFKQYGLYRILYRNSLIKGIDDESGLASVLKAGFIGIALSALAVLLFTAAALLGAPMWLGFISNALFATAATYIAALIYGVVNDLFATKANLPYFLLGHQPQQNSVYAAMILLSKD